MKHYILTRFNLRLWPHNKRGEETQTEEWLRHRVGVFETYCLPSLSAQTCKDFVWVVLVDAESPAWLSEKFVKWKAECPQMVTVPVEPRLSRKFVDVFQHVVNKLRGGDGGECITTYLDNDDAIAVNFVEDVQKRLASAVSGTVLTYVHGLQYFTELKIATRILFRHNHFLSVVENGSCVKTIFGYGSHYYVWQRKDVKIEYADPKEAMWMEIVHEKNVDNDVWMTFDTRLQKENPFNRFGINIGYASNPKLVFATRFLVRVIRIFFVHLKHKLFGHDWWK